MQKSPDYGDPHPDKGWSLRTWAIVFVLTNIVVGYLLFI